MLDINSVNRIYTDIELMDKASKYFFANNMKDADFEKAIDMLSNILDYDNDFIKGYVKKAIQDLSTVQIADTTAIATLPKYLLHDSSKKGLQI